MARSLKKKPKEGSVWYHALEDSSDLTVDSGEDHKPTAASEFQEDLLCPDITPNVSEPTSCNSMVVSEHHSLSVTGVTVDTVVSVSSKSDVTEIDPSVYLSHHIQMFERNGLSNEEIISLLHELQEEVHASFPGFYDFCIIANEDDYEPAKRLKDHLCETFDLKGCMLQDGFYRIGADLFTCFEEMMSRSTKVFFYLTDSFNANQFYRRLQSGAVFQSLMSCVRAHKEKCVPIFPNGMNVYVPLPLAGISGIQPNMSVSVKHAISNTYTFSVREKRRMLELKNNQERLEYMKENFVRKANNMLEEKQKCLEINKTVCTYDSKYENKTCSDDLDIRNAISSLPISEGDKRNVRDFLAISETTAATNIQLQNSSGIHVGTKVTFNINMNSQNTVNTSYDNDTSSDEKESDTEDSD